MSSPISDHLHSLIDKYKILYAMLSMSRGGHKNVTLEKLEKEKKKSHTQFIKTETNKKMIMIFIGLTWKRKKYKKRWKWQLLY